MAASGRAGRGSPGGQAPRPRCPRGAPRALALCCAPVPCPWALRGAPCRIPPPVAQRRSRGVSPRQPWCGCGRLAEAAHGRQGGGGGGGGGAPRVGRALPRPLPRPPLHAVRDWSPALFNTLTVAFSEMFCSRYKRNISSGPSLPSVPTSRGAPGAPPSSPCPPRHLASTTCGHVTLAESVLLGVLSATAPAPLALIPRGPTQPGRAVSGPMGTSLLLRTQTLAEDPLCPKAALPGRCRPGLGGVVCQRRVGKRERAGWRVELWCWWLREPLPGPRVAQAASASPQAASSGDEHRASRGLPADAKISQPVGRFFWGLSLSCPLTCVLLTFVCESESAHNLAKGTSTDENKTTLVSPANRHVCKTRVELKTVS